MLKLNTYKRGYNKVFCFNRRAFFIKNFIFNVLQQMCFFDGFLSSCRRMCLLFIWSHYTYRSSILKIKTLKAQCLASWRTGSVFSFFRLTRLELRERAHKGFLRGIRKSSW